MALYVIHGCPHFFAQSVQQFEMREFLRKSTKAMQKTAATQRRVTTHKYAVELTERIFERFSIDVLPFKISLPHLAIQKGWLFDFYIFNKLILHNLLNQKCYKICQPIPESSFDDITITTIFLMFPSIKFLKGLQSHICKTYCIDNNILSATISNEELENFKVTLTHSNYKGMNDG